MLSQVNTEIIFNYGSTASDLCGYWILTLRLIMRMLLAMLLCLLVVQCQESMDLSNSKLLWLWESNIWIRCIDKNQTAVVRNISINSDSYIRHLSCLTSCGYCNTTNRPPTLHNYNSLCLVNSGTMTWHGCCFVFSGTFEAIAQMLSQADSPMFRAEECKVGVFLNLHKHHSYFTVCGYFNKIK